MLKYRIIWTLAEKPFRVCLEVLHSLNNLGEVPGKIMNTKEDCSLADANCTSESQRTIWSSGFDVVVICCDIIRLLSLMHEKDTDFR